MRDSSDSSEDSDEDPPKKRKAEADVMPTQKKAKTQPTEGGVTNFFVGQLSWNVDDDWLKREFSEVGEVVSARVITDRESGKSRG